MDVMIDGTRYVPVSDAHISARAIEDAVVETWAGDNWREHYPDALSYLRVIVTEEEASGESVPEFVARVLARAGGEPAAEPRAAVPCESTAAHAAHGDCPGVKVTS